MSLFILNMALSFPGPMPPRNLNGGVEAGVEALREGGSEM